MRQTYEPVAACIFCRDFVGPVRPGSLTDEHILAFSLGGTATLPKATCAVHQEITRDLDQVMARRWLGTARHAMGLPSRTRSDWKPHYRLRVTNRTTNISYFIDVPVAEMPRLYVYENLGPPGVSIGAPPNVFRGAPLCWAPSDALQRLVDRLPRVSEVSSPSGEYVVGQLDRMLAKVAHTYLTAELGHENFVPTLLEIIEGEIGNSRNFVGGFDPPAKQEDTECSLREEVLGGVHYAIVSLSIKALPDLPRFQVVAGVLIDPLPFPERSRSARDEAREQQRLERRRQAEASGLLGRAKEQSYPRAKLPRK